MSPEEPGESASRAPSPTPPAGRPQPVLSGLRVIDMTEALAGPLCTMYLGDLGAEVIKVERRGKGDQCRGWGPPFIEGESAYFMSANRNKRSLTLDAKKPEGQAILHELLARADVFVNNLPRVSSMVELGVDPGACLARNPRLIHVSVSGFGRYGPRAHQPGYDILAQGMSGTMSLTGDPGGPPYRFPTPIADMTAGLYALIGALAALLERERTGRGQAVDVSLLESQMSWLHTVAGSYFATNERPEKPGNQHPSITPYQPFQTADDYIIVAAGSERIWSRLCAVLELSVNVRDDPRFVDNPSRNANRAALTELLTRRFRTRPSSFWLEALERADIPSGPIFWLDQALSDPHVLARTFVVQLEHPVAGLVRSLAFPAHMRQGGVSYRCPAPTLGQHNTEILAELGYGAADAERLRASEVV